MDFTIHNVANYIHVLATLALLMKIWCTQSCAGISGKAQFMYALVYTTRYLDLFTTYSSMSMIFNFVKILYTTLGYLTVVSIYGFFRKTHQHKYDTFRVELLMVACAIFAIFINHEFSRMEVLWTFSIYLESVAILPQFCFIASAKRVHKHVLCYILALGIYKGMYIVHWIYRYYAEGLFDHITAASGLVQFVIYCDFFARVLPYVKRADGDEQIQQQQQQQQKDVAVINVETGDAAAAAASHAGYISGNISTIVLTPASLLDNGNDKVALLKDEIEQEKY